MSILVIILGVFVQVNKRRILGLPLEQSIVSQRIIVTWLSIVQS